MPNFITLSRLIEILVALVLATLVGLVVMAVRHVRTAAERTSDL